MNKTLLAAGGVLATAGTMAAVRRARQPTPQPRTGGKKVLVLGGGFGGFYAAMDLGKKLKDHSGVSVTLIARDNFFTFQPLLPDVISGNTEMRHIAIPLRRHLHQTGVNFLRAEIEGVDLENKTVQTSRGPMEYEKLVIALGGQPAYFGVEGADEHTLKLWDLRDGLRMRNAIISRFEEAAALQPEDYPPGLLTFTIVGGGYSGVEAAGEVYDLIHNGIRADYPWVDYGQARLVLAEGLPDILPEIDPALRSVGRRRLINLGVEIRTGDFVSEITPEGLSFKGGEFLPCTTTLWTAGGRGSEVLESVSAEKNEMNRLVVNEDLSLPEHDDVWAIGDAAAAPGTDGKAAPPTAQVATQQTGIAAHNVFASLTEGQPQTFEFKPLGQVIEVGGAFALSEIMGWKASGALGHALSRSVHLQRLSDRQKRVRVLADWALDLVFRPDTSDLGRV